MGKSLKLIVESLLFASDKPLNPRDIHSALSDVKLADVKSALRVLQYEYEAMGRSFGLKEIANGYQFRSHADYGPFIVKMLQTSPNRLSRATMETLAIIAYKQPLLRQEIEMIRGVDVGGVLRTLLEKSLIRIMGRKNLPGRPHHLLGHASDGACVCTIENLIEDLKDESGSVRWHSAQALKMINTPEAQKALEEYKQKSN